MRAGSAAVAVGVRPVAAWLGSGQAEIKVVARTKRLVVRMAPAPLSICGNEQMSRSSRVQPIGSAIDDSLQWRRSADTLEYGLDLGGNGDVATEQRPYR